MRAEIQAIADEITQAVGLLKRHLDWDRALKRLDELNALSEDPNLWSDPASAQKLMRERQVLERNITNIRGLEQSLTDSAELIEMGEAEDDADVVAEAEQSIRAMQDEVRAKQIEALLSGEADGSDTYVEIHAGAGGTEAQDWVQMLLRMYQRYAERAGFKVDLEAEMPGEEAGLKSATLLIKGENAHGWLKTESGVHRLVRISPFDSAARRQTSFASVWVYPVVDDNVEIDIQDKDIRLDTYRSSGAGGQHVNTTDSAVRITHIPTGIVVTSSEKSQHQNRANAMKALRARLYDMEMKRRLEATQDAHEAKTDIGWGHQIRSYVLQPYQMVKDTRTAVESTNPSAVLDGELTEFLEAALASKITQPEAASG